MGKMFKSDSGGDLLDFACRSDKQPFGFPYADMNDVFPKVKTRQSVKYTAQV